MTTNNLNGEKNMLNEPESNNQSVSMEQKKLDEIKAGYGEDSYEYETMAENFSLGLNDYTRIMNGIEKRMAALPSGFDDALSANDIQDGLNDYLENIDIHPNEDNVDDITRYILSQGEISTDNNMMFEEPMEL